MTSSVHADPFHMGWFVGGGFSVKDWRGPWAGTQARDWASGELIIDLARSLERACFDFIMIEDSSNVPYTHGNSAEAYLKNAMSVMKNDPSVLVSLISQHTRHIGIAPTLSTTEYPPYLLARLVNTLDHVSKGRVGWNIVTGSNDGAAQNYGMDKQINHDLRYRMAEEYWDLVIALWDSWDADAVVADQETGVWADHTKVHTLNFEGEFFRSRGPLNSPRSPQVRPVFVQAGSSVPGLRFGGRVANVTISKASGIAGMKKFRDAVREQMALIGRPFDQSKSMFLITPVLGETVAEAREKARRIHQDELDNLEPAIAELSRATGRDLSIYDVDEPLPRLESNGHQSEADGMTGRTLREVVGYQPSMSEMFIGTPDSVAAEMDEVMQEVGGDGFLIAQRYFNRRYIAEIADGLMPALQRRGLTRTEYASSLFRDNLLAF